MIQRPTISVVCDEPGCGNVWTVGIGQPREDGSYLPTDMNERCKAAGWAVVGGKHRCLDCNTKHAQEETR